MKEIKTNITVRLSVATVEAAQRLVDQHGGTVSGHIARIIEKHFQEKPAVPATLHQDFNPSGVGNDG
ncbi:hypothetical protein VF14_18315 [Nostoc linckia z18]|uniref:Uncharacterized protein n=2 Tax=Nostoc linckia TaxID=92942 RepID=A0A9Q5Z966_NOSLI|nr:hypothetical protein [Nostoc linckia]PHJ53457.1 hypothetical protein VF02_37200 [Nostoc linckia z1]PHJ81975.1 hypothetical protein VF07_29215 [Nostoc linckia z6]PHJ92873.1 hypothetical protein VF04_27930 [Nostoc linckia z7]PHK00804.1 hypothetical protein VF08_23315 [Nostoc linckia z8]PHK09318.1 hypothetical protein VF09_15990 [Nostoc linckia z9]